MLEYFIALFVYLLSFPVPLFVTGSLTISLLIKLIACSVALFYYKKLFRFRIRFDFLAVLTGIIIFIAWVSLEGKYTPAGGSVVYDYSPIDIILKLLIGVAIAPVIEEIFTRFFLNRWIISKDWKKVKQGAFSPASFVVTVLFFGFSHNMWLPGIITGILLNLLYYKTKKIESCILAHAVANLILGVFVVMTGAWQFW